MDTSREENIKTIKGFFHSNNNNLENLSDKEISEFCHFIKFMGGK